MYVCVTIVIYFIVLRITGTGLLMKQLYYNVARVIIMLQITYILTWDCGSGGRDMTEIT